MKKSKNILDFFAAQSANVLCPACGIYVLKSQLNIHLDMQCSSSITDKSLQSNVHKDPNCLKVVESKSTMTKDKAKNNKLSLKSQRNLSASTSKVPDEIIVIDLEKDISNNTLMLCKPDPSSVTNGLTAAKSSKDINHDVVVTRNSNCPNYNSSEKGILNTSKEEKIFYKQTRENFLYENNKCKPPSESEVFSLNHQTDKLDTINETKLSEKCLVSDYSLNSAHMLTNSKKSTFGVYSTVDNTQMQNSLSLSNEVFSCESHITNISSLRNQTDDKICSTNSNIDPDAIALLHDIDNTELNENTEIPDILKNSEGDQSKENYSPYYIANFKHIVSTVLNDEYNKILFNDEDMSFVNSFQSVSEAAQKLYVRLFQRKYNWLRLNKINYPNITSNPQKVLDELVNAKLVDSGLDEINLETSLELLSLPEARILCKQFNFNSSGKSKVDIIQVLLKHCKEHKAVFFSRGNNNVSNSMLKKAKQLLGPCFRIALLPKRLFTRILMLFSLPTMSEDDDDAAGGQQQQLLTLLQVNKGELTFPNYTINRETSIFIDRDELIRYEVAKQLENDIMNAVENKNFELAKSLYFEAKDEFEEQLNSAYVERPASLPSFLKKYSSFHIYVRCLTQGVEIFQRLREYKEAVSLLKRLLDQKVFCQDYKGRWYDRLALNLEQHLKQPKQALEAIKRGLKDENVRVGYRYSLLLRALRILKSTDDADPLKKEILEEANVIEAPKVVIRGRLFPRNILGRRHVFISSSNSVESNDDITVLGVEQLAIEHYKNEGYSEGIHGEGATFHALYGLLFWDIIYNGDIPDAFISPYQTHPLDLNHDGFYSRRKKQILSHLQMLKKSSLDDIALIIKSTWEAHFGQSSIVVWDLFTDVEHALGLVNSLGIPLLCGICKRLATDFRFTRSGVPDLVVWNPSTFKAKIVEVKGPGDKLSSKQILWLDYLLNIGADAEVCHVEAVGAKKLRRE